MLDRIASQDIVYINKTKGIFCHDREQIIETLFKLSFKKNELIIWYWYHLRCFQMLIIYNSYQKSKFLKNQNFKQLEHTWPKKLIIQNFLQNPS